MRVRCLVAALILLTIAMSIDEARADLIAFDFSTSTQNVLGFTTDQDFGIEFSPTTNMLVTSLLVWDSGGDDFESFDADVAIWDVSSPGMPVVAGAISAAGSPTQPSASISLGSWRVVDVPDTLLMSGATYRLAADGFLGNDFGRATQITPVLNGITLSSLNPGVESSPASSWVSGPEYPNFAGPAIWATASFTYTAVPEPSTCVLVLFGGAVMSGRRRARY